MFCGFARVTPGHCSSACSESPNALDQVKEFRTYKPVAEAMLQARGEAVVVVVAYRIHPGDRRRKLGSGRRACTPRQPEVTNALHVAVTGFGSA